MLPPNLAESAAVGINEEVDEDDECDSKSIPNQQMINPGLGMNPAGLLAGFAGNPFLAAAAAAMVENMLTNPFVAAAANSQGSFIDLGELLTICFLNELKLKEPGRITCSKCRIYI